MTRSNVPFLFVVVLLLVSSCQSFVAPSTTRQRHKVLPPTQPQSILGTTPWQQQASNDDNNNEQPDGKASATKLSLEEKMKSWEATQEELQAASLGGLVPGGNNDNRSDAFDVGLYVAFPLMVLSGLAFAFFPLIMGNLDVDSVGPPPTM